VPGSAVPNAVFKLERIAVDLPGKYQDFRLGRKRTSFCERYCATHQDVDEFDEASTV